MVDAKIYIAAVAALLSLGYVAVDNVMDPTHYCTDRLLMAKCFELSSTMKTCYTLPFYNGGKRCSSLWKEIQETPSVPEPEPVIQQGSAPPPVFTDYTKAPNGVDCFLQGNLRRRVKCDEI